MHFAEELVRPTSLQIPADLSIGGRELQMATELIDRLSTSWEPDKYKDDYQHALMELIQKKIEAGGRVAAGDKMSSKRAATKVIDLLSVLQESLAKTSRGGSHKSAREHRPKRMLKKAA
jgi:DNA end-binding protein Ku